MILSNSKIKTFKSCPQSYYYKYVEKLKPKYVALPLFRGVILHEALEEYYNEGTVKSILNVIESYREEFDKFPQEVKDKYGSNTIDDCIEIMKGYIAKYDLLDTTKEKIIKVEFDFVEEPLVICNELPDVKLSGKIDLISEDDYGIWITEHKTHKAFPTEENRFLDIQTAFYSLVVKKHLGLNPVGIRWNYLRTKVPDEVKILKKGGLSKAISIDTTQEKYLQAIEENGLKVEDYTDVLDKLANNKFFDRNYQPINNKMEKFVIQDLANVVEGIKMAEEKPYRCLDKFTCQNCNYKELCKAEIFNLDVEYLKRTNYKQKGEEND